ncbi:MAG: hypothetical protein M0Z94_06725 [Dehalococcoidales bacterium]|nr:hypothetical protein [Dehalococcoidales bacterium]
MHPNSIRFLALLGDLIIIAGAVLVLGALFVATSLQQVIVTGLLGVLLLLSGDMVVSIGSALQASRAWNDFLKGGD